MMQTNHDSRFALMPAAGALSHYFTEVSQGAVSILKGIRWDGLFGAVQDSNNSVARDSKRLAYEIKQSVGIKGFVLNLTSSPALATGLPACWDVVRPCLETPEFEDATAQILSEVSRLAEDMGDTNQKSSLRLRHDEAAQLQVELDFYRFLLPKMLLLSSTLRLACDHALNIRRSVEGHVREKNAVRADGLHGLFQSIKGILSVTHGQSAAALPRAWSKYLIAASAQLEPLVQGENYHRASAQLLKVSRQLAPGFQEQISAVEIDSLEAIAKQVARFEAHLPSLIISITLLELYLRPADSLLLARPSPSKPTPAANRAPTPKRHAAFQPVMTPPTGMPYPA